MGVYFDITPYLPEIVDRLGRGDSLRMVASYVGIDHSTLSKKLKRLGVRVPSREESVKMIWKHYTHPRLGKKGEQCPVYGRKISAATREKMTPIWKKIGESQRKYRKKHSGGYTLIYIPDHPMADRTGYVLEHRVVVESFLGRCLSSSEIVHHINGDKSDNRIDNLEVVSRATHAKIHNNLGGINR